ncbi:MAG: hypothetical protein PHP85_08510 [Gallionella sp.]|nr:hypothetical protein [Gallionella sp.]
MYAVEFETISKNGIIEIPPAYREFSSSSLRVVLMMNDAQKDSKRAQLQARIDEGIASGIGNRSMSELKNIAQSRFSADAK